MVVNFSQNIVFKPILTNSCQRLHKIAEIRRMSARHTLTGLEQKRSSAERPDLLTVVLPQSLGKQPPESQELLKQVQETGAKIIEMPDNDDLTLFEASSICNNDIISRVQQIICFAFHDSKLLLETCRDAKENKKMVTLFYLD